MAAALIWVKGKILRVASSGVVVMAAPALAADLAVKAAPGYAAPMYSRSGFHFGGDGGWGGAG